MAKADHPDRPPSGPPRAARDDDKPVLPDVTADERDAGWGDDPEAGHRDIEWYRRERPPHHE